MWNKQRYCGRLQSHVWIQNFRKSNWKITMLGKSEYLFVVLWHGRSCQEMCGTILWIGEQDDSTTLQSIISMLRRPSLQRRRIEIRGRIVKSMLSNCSEMLVLGTYWKTRYSMVSEQTCTVDYKNGPKPVTNDYLAWSLTFIIHVNTNNIVMWETLPNNAEWDCLKTPILQEILKIQNLHQVEHCAFWEAIRLFQSVGCVRNKLQFRTVQQNQKSSLWTQDWGWTVYPHLIYGIWSSQFFTKTRIRVIKHGATCARTFVQHFTNFKNERKLMEWLMIWTMLILFSQTSILLVRRLCCMCLKTTKQWSRWS